MRPADKLDMTMLVIGLGIAAIGVFQPWGIHNPEATKAMGNGLIFAPVFRIFLRGWNID